MVRDAGIVVLLAGAVFAGDTSLDREVEHYLEKTATAAPALRSTWANRIRFESDDGDFRLDVIGWLLWDNVWSTSDEFPSDNSTVFRSVRIGVQGYAYRNSVYKLQLELAGPEVGMRDVFVGLRRLGSSGMSVIAGHFKEPFGLEFLTPLGALFFLERSAATRAFVPDRNSGIMLSSSEAYNLGPRAPGTGWFQERIAWAIGVFRTTDNQGRTNGASSDPALTLRLSGLVIERPESSTVLHLGFAYTHRTDATARYVSDVGRVDTGRMAVDRSSRFAFEFVYVRGGLSISAEIFLTSDDQTAGANTSFVGGYIEIGTWLTGDGQAWHIDRFLTTAPRRNLLDGQGGAGGIWVGYRFDLLDLNDGAIQGGRERTHTIGINWAWNWNTRVMLNYLLVDVEDGPLGSGTIHILGLRMQFNF